MHITLNQVVNSRISVYSFSVFMLNMPFLLHSQADRCSWVDETGSEAPPCAQEYGMERCKQAVFHPLQRQVAEDPQHLNCNSHWQQQPAFLIFLWWQILLPFPWGCGPLSYRLSRCSCTHPSVIHLIPWSHNPSLFPYWGLLPSNWSGAQASSGSMCYCSCWDEPRWVTQDHRRNICI